MAPANGDAAGPSSSQDDSVATMKKRNRPQCNLSSDKEAKIVFFISSLNLFHLRTGVFAPNNRLLVPTLFCYMS
jgi:hypothetical protein